MFFILDYPHFITFYVYFWVKMHKIPIFYRFFSIFANFDQFRPNFEASLLFSKFFQLIITYHVLSILDYPHFIIFNIFVCIKMHTIPIFYQLFSIFANFDQFRPNLCGIPTFFSFFFHLIITYHVFFISEYPQFIIFMYFFV